MRRATDESRRQFAERLARPMATLALAFLVVTGAGIQRIAGPVYRGQEHIPLTRAELLFFTITLAGLWLATLVEVLVRFWMRDRSERFWRHHRADLVACLCPPLRLAQRSRAMGGRVWLPLAGWQEPSRTLRERLERFFGVPMIVVALMILPVLAVEHYLPQYVDPAENLWLVLLLDVCTVFIWVAFAAEFIVMLSVAEDKWTYCRRHWLDIAIIVLPLISFARTLRLARAVRLGRVVGKAGQVTRLYRLRGLAIRAYRGLLLLEVVRRLIPVSPARRLKRLQAALAEKEAEVADLRRAIAEVESEIAARAQVTPPETTPSEPVPAKVNPSA